MKFTQKLAAHLTPEWRKQYIDYEGLKHMLLRCVDQAPHVGNNVTQEQVMNYYELFDEEFFQECERELLKISRFFEEKLAEAKRKNDELVTELIMIKQTADGLRVPQSRIDLRVVLDKRSTNTLKLAYSEFYLSLVLLQNYQNLNHTGFRKILKKHDKLLKNDNGRVWFIDNVDNASFYTNRELIQLIQKTENNFTNYLEGGDRSRAMKRLRVPPLSKEQHAVTTFFLGLFTGGCLILLSVILLKMHYYEFSLNNHIAFVQLFRGPFLLILLLLLISINVYEWRAVGVNHILIFEIEPRSHLTSFDIANQAMVLAFFLALSTLGFLYHDYLGMPPFISPLILMTLMLGYLLNPFHILNYTSRIWFLKLLGRVLSAPFFPVGFADFWLGDQMNSLVICLTDYKFTICFYVTNWNEYNVKNPHECMDEDYVITTLVRCIPAWVRFAQCLRRYRDTGKAFPFLVNAGKYFSSFPMYTFGVLKDISRDSYQNTFENPFVWGFIICHIVHSIYTYSWDVLNDFGLFKKFSGENIFLRDQIIYRPVFYYFAIIENFIMRFFWAPAFYLTEQKLIASYNMNTIQGVCEVFRRYVWNYFRLENEHLFNAGQFRAVRDISIAPIYPTDQVTLTRLMDEFNGVKNRHTDDSS